MKQLTVAIVTPGRFVIPSGKSSSVEMAVQRVAEQLSQQIRVYVVGKKKKALPWREVRSGVTYLRSLYASSTSYIGLVSKRLASLHADIIQVENRPRFIRFLRKRLPGSTLWLVLHSITYISEPQIGQDELRKCLRCADKIVVNSQFLKEEVLRRVPGMDGKLVVNYLGVDPKRFLSRWSEQGESLRAELLKKLGYKHKKIILYVGRLIAIKGVHHLIKVMRKIKEKRPDALLVIVGGASYGSARRTRYVQKLHKLAYSMPNHVRFIPYVPHEEIPKWFRIADVVTVPSAQNEAFGLVNVEAMATGVPVIATDSGGIKEIVEHEITGFLMRPEAIERELETYLLQILNNPLLQREMGERSIGRVQQHFTWERSADGLLSLYRSLR